MICIICGRASSQPGWLCQQCAATERPETVNRREYDSPRRSSIEENSRDLSAMFKFLWVGFAVLLSVIAFAVLGIGGIFVTAHLIRMTYRGFNHSQYSSSNTSANLAQSFNVEPKYYGPTPQSSNSTGPQFPKTQSSRIEPHNLRQLIGASVVAVAIAAGIMLFWPHESVGSKDDGHDAISYKVESVQPFIPNALLEKQKQLSKPSPTPSVPETPPISTTIYSNAKLGFTVIAPPEFRASSSNQEDNARFSAQDGAILLAFGTYLPWASSLESEVHRISLMQNTTITYKLIRSDGFVVSGTRDQAVFYQKSYLRNGNIISVRVEYPLELKDKYDPLVDSLLRSLQLNGN